MGSLMEGIEVGQDKTKGKGGRGASGGEGEGSKTLKLTVAIVCLVVGGGLIAWNLGWFGAGVPTPDPALVNANQTPQPDQPTQPGGQGRPTAAPIFNNTGEVRP